MGKSLKEKNVEKTVFLRLNANRVPEGRQVRGKIARQQDERDAFQYRTKAVQAWVARWGNTFEIIDA